MANVVVVLLLCNISYFIPLPSFTLQPWSQILSGEGAQMYDCSFSCDCKHAIGQRWPMACCGMLASRSMHKTSVGCACALHVARCHAEHSVPQSLAPQPTAFDSISAMRHAANSPGLHWPRAAPAAAGGRPRQYILERRSCSMRAWYLASVFACGVARRIALVLATHGYCPVYVLHGPTQTCRHDHKHHMQPLNKLQNCVTPTGTHTASWAPTARGMSRPLSQPAPTPAIIAGRFSNGDHG